MDDLTGKRRGPYQALGPLDKGGFGRRLQSLSTGRRANCDQQPALPTRRRDKRYSP